MAEATKKVQKMGKKYAIVAISAKGQRKIVKLYGTQAEAKAALK